MASLLIRNLEDDVKTRLRVRAAENGRSMEEEARAILKAAVTDKRPRERNLADAIRERVMAVGGIDLPVIPREPMREPPRFDE